MDYPPSKRLKGLDLEDDPFGDDDDFTQDDLDEIDILASQATGDPRGTSSKSMLGGSSSKSTLGGSSSKPTLGGSSSKPTLGGSSSTPTYGGLYPPGHGEANKALTKARTNQSRDCNVTPGNGSAHREALGNGQQLNSDREQYYCQLEVQQAELKRKLKEVEEEILVKNGEIRVLRDSLRGAQQEKEVQRQAQLLLEKEKKREHNDKEKELTKKVQSLQSELQFKEAEMIEMKTKLQNSERSSKTVASPLPRNSPRVLSAVAQMHHGSSSSSSSPMGSGFITKETFSAQLPSRTTPVKNPGSAQSREDRQVSSSRPCDNKEAPLHPDPFLSSGPPQHQHQGSILLRLLLQQPLSPSSLGLCHLLCLSPDALPAPLNSYLSPGLSVGSSSSPGQKDRTRPGAIRPSGFNPIQSVAVAGLSMMSLPQSGPDTHPAVGTRSCKRYGPDTHPAAGTRSSKRSCPGAVHLLPLLDHHLARFCHSLDSLRTSQSTSSSSETSTGYGPGDSTSSGSSSLACGMQEDGGVGIEEFGLAALRVLSLLLAHSDEVVESVLSEPIQAPETADKPKVGVSNRKTTTPPDAGLQSQHAVLQRLLQLCDPGFSSGSGQREVLVRTGLKTLCILMDRTPHSHTHRLQCVLSRGTSSVCLSVDSSLQTVSDCVSVLASVADHDQLAELLCSQHESCLFMKLFHYIRIRPDKSATESQWVLLDLQVVRTLSRLFSQRVKSWTSYVQANCQCYTEVVQSVVVVLHRQWLEIRGREMGHTDAQPPPDQGLPTWLPGTIAAGSRAQPWWFCPGVELLREALVLLHWLLLHHGSFSERCRPVLHMYDQVIPAVRDTLRRVPDLSESEELALEDLCRSESDDTEDMDTDTGS